MSLSSNDQEFLHRCIYDFFLWTNDIPLIDALQKAHPEACQHRTSLPSDPPLLISALHKVRDTQNSSTTTNNNGHVQRESSSSSPMMVDEPASKPLASVARTAAPKRKERSLSPKVPNHNLLITATSTKTTTTAAASSVETKSPVLVWKDYYEVLIQQKISKEQIPPDSLDPRGMLSWCVHQRWVYKKYHDEKSLSEDAQEAVSHLSTERIQKLDSLGFEWDMTKDTHPQDCSDQIIVDRQTQSPAQLNQWKQELEQYKPYFSTIQTSNGKNAQSSKPALQTPQEAEQHEVDATDTVDAMDDNDSSVQEKAKEWLAIQIQRYREWDAGFVDFSKEQRHALHSLHLLPELTEQSDHNRYNLLLHGNNTATTDVQDDEPSDNGNDSDSDNDNESSSSDTEDDEQESNDGLSDTKAQRDTTRATKDGSSIRSTYKAKRSLQSDELWQTHFQELLDFQTKHGHLQVTRRMDIKLARWATKERAKYRQSKESYPKDRKKKLDHIGFCWEPTALSTKLKTKTPSTPSRSTVIDWGERLAQMKAFHKKYGHVHVTNSLDAKLSSWVKKERIRYRQNKAAYPSDRKKSLDELGFCWEPIVAIKSQEHQPYPGTMAAEKDAIWWKRFQELKEFKERFGHVRVPSRWNENRELSNWYRHTKERYRGFLEGLNRFPKSRQNALEEIDFHQLSQITRVPKARKTKAIDPSENNETLEAVEIPAKSDEESADDHDAASARSLNATDSDTSPPQSKLVDPISAKTTELLRKDTSTPSDGDSYMEGKQQIDPSKTKNDAITSPSEFRAVLWTSSRKRMRLPMQHEAKHPSRSAP